MPAVLSLGCAVLAACAERQLPAVDVTDPAVPVIVESLRLDHARTRLEAIGTSRALQSIELYPAVAGEVVAIHFEPGQQREQGDVLLELDQRDAALAVSLAELQLKDAGQLFDRYQRSGASGAVLPTTIDTAATAVQAAQIALDRARVALDLHSIEAPFDGHVGISQIDPGDRINPETLIASFDDRSALLVSFDVPESLLGKLNVGDEVGVATWSAAAPPMVGVIDSVASRIDPATRTFEARALVANDTDALRPGMSFRVSARIAGEKHPIIAETAVQWGADGAYVWTVVGGQARRLPVNVIQRQQGAVLVSADLSAGDLIVVEGVQRMRDGLDVRYEPPSLAERQPQPANGAPAVQRN